MRTALVLFVCLGAAVALALDPVPARAEEEATPHSRVPLAAPPAPRQVPVPDVRGIDEAAARRALAEGGLTLGGVERVRIEQLRAELGRMYTPGMVVQQAPAPSTGDQPSWLPRGGKVWLRVAAARGAGAAASATPRYRAPVRSPAPAPAPLGRMPRYTGNSPVPAPPTLPRGSQPVVVAPQPEALPRWEPTEPTVPQPVVPQPREEPAYVEPLAPEPQAWAGASDLRTRIGLPCERGQERFHVRPVGGAAFWLGDDDSDVDVYAGVDVGVTFASCIGVDVFYRYTAGTFDTQVMGGTLEDAGVFHHVGIKGTWNASLDGSGRVYFFAGLGVAYYWTSDLVTDDDGVSGFAELGIGYALSNAIRMRLGLNLHAMDTEAGRLLAAGDARVLWTLAPTLGLELDL